MKRYNVIALGVLLSGSAFADLRMFSVGGEFARLFIPHGMCVLNDEAVSRLDFERELLGPNEVIAVFMPCGVLEDGVVVSEPHVWVMWLVQHGILPKTMSRREFVVQRDAEVRSRSDLKILATDEDTVYAAMKIAGKHDAMSAVMALTMVNARAVSLNLYGPYSSARPTHLLELSKTVVGKTIAEQPLGPMSRMEKVVNRGMTGGPGGLFYTIAGVVMYLVAWLVNLSVTRRRRSP